MDRRRPAWPSARKEEGDGRLLKTFDDLRGSTPDWGVAQG